MKIQTHINKQTGVYFAVIGVLVVLLALAVNIGLFASSAQVYSLARMFGFFLIVGSLAFFVEEFWEKPQRTRIGKRFKSHIWVLVGSLLMIALLVIGTMMMVKNAVFGNKYWLDALFIAEILVVGTSCFKK